MIIEFKYGHGASPMVIRGQLLEVNAQMFRCGDWRKPAAKCIDSATYLCSAVVAVKVIEAE